MTAQVLFFDVFSEKDQQLNAVEKISICDALLPHDLFNDISECVMP